MSGRSRGAGIRVVRGETTGFAHTADLSETGLGRRRRGRGRRVHRGGRAVPGRRPLGGGPPRPAAAVLPETVAKDAKVAMLQRADAAARERSGVDPAGERVLRRRPPPRPRRQLRRRVRRGRPGPHALHGHLRGRGRHRVAHRHRSAGPHRRVRAASTSSSPKRSHASRPIDIGAWAPRRGRRTPAEARPSTRSTFASGFQSELRRDPDARAVRAQLAIRRSQS